MKSAKRVGKTWEIDPKMMRKPLRFKDRNQKKVLSLVLCVAVMLSVMVMGAGAAFSDQADIENTEAVNMCSALNIIGGYEDGTFHPERNIKRSEVTKMICVALNGGKEPNVSTNAVPTFNDVRGTADAWAEGYIESCVAQGIVSGVGGGRFSPAGNVTGAQLAKMLLVCLGYDASIEGFTGNAWETNVNVRAAQKHLYEGLESMDTSAAITRDNAAQMVWNAMNAYEVEYKTTVVTDENGNLVTQNVAVDKVVLSTNDKITLLEDKYEVGVNVGTLTEIDGKTLRIVMSDSDKADSSDENLVTFLDLDTDYSSLLGQKVKVMYKKNNDVLGVYATGDSTVVTANQKDVSVDAGKISIDGTRYTLEDNGVTLYVNGEMASSKYKAGDFKDSQSASVLTFVDSDGNDKIDTAWETTYEVAKVTFASDSQIIAGGKTYRADEDNIQKDLAKDDWIIVTHNLYNSNLDIVKAELATGTLTATKDMSGTPAWKQFQIGETWYNESNESTKDINGNAKPGVNVEYVAVNGILFYAARTTGTSQLDNVLFLSYVGTNGLNDNQAKVMFPNGKTETITLAETKVEGVQNGTNKTAWDGMYDGDKIANVSADVTNGGTTATAGSFYEYTKTSSGYKLSFIRPELTFSGYYGDYTAVASTFLDLKDSNDGQAGEVDTLNGVKIDDNADVIVYSSAGSGATYKSAVKHITGKQLKNLTLHASDSDAVRPTALGAFTSDVNGLTRVTVLAVKWVDQTAGTLDHMTAGGSYANYGFILGEDARDLGDTISFKLWTVDGEKNVIAEVGNTNGYTEGAIVGYSSIEEDDNGNLIIEDSEPVASGNVSTGAIEKTDGKADGKIQLNDSTTEMDLSDYTTVLYVNSKDGVGVENGAPVVASKVTVDKDYYATNVLYSKSTLDFVVIDVVEFTTDTYSSYALNQPADMTGLNTVQYVNSRTSETDTSAFEGAIVELKVNAAVNGTMTLTGAKNIENGKTTLDIVAGDNTFDIVVDGTGAVTPTFTASGSTTPSTGEKITSLEFKPNWTFDDISAANLDIVYENAVGKRPSYIIYKKGDSGKTNLVGSKFTAGTAFTLPSNNDAAAQTTTVTLAGADAGDYVLELTVGGATKTVEFTVAKAKISALGTLSGLPTASDAAATVNAPYTVTGATPGLNAVVTVIEKTNNGSTEGTIEATDIATATLTITADANHVLDSTAPAASSVGSSWVAGTHTATSWVYTLDITVGP